MKYILVFIIGIIVGMNILGYIATQTCKENGFDRWNSLGCYHEVYK
jgi:hypothetical protein